MVDIHSHIINGVDDGAKTLEESLEILRDEIDQGVTDVILTPHFNKYKWDVAREDAEEGYRRLVQLVEEHRLDIRLYLGNEVYYKSKESFVRKLEKKNYFTLANTQYFMLELSTVGVVEDLAEGCYELYMEGLVPVIAHVERYPYLFEEKGMVTLKEAMRQGALLQVNCDSILSQKNKEAHEFVRFLLGRKAVSFVASDVHNMTTRNSRIKAAYREVEYLHGKDYADLIFTRNGLKLLQGLEIEAPALDVRGEKKSFLKKLFNR